jgi:hypothetical protein
MTTISKDVIEHLVQMAGHAPSVHNTQPWLLRATPSGGLLLLRDPSRQLEVLDPTGRELLVSCGALLHHIEVASRALGLDTSIDVNLTGDCVAEIALEKGAPPSETEIAAATAILHRHTHRGRYQDRAVSDLDVVALEAAVTAQGGLLRVVRETELTEVAVLVSRAERELHHLEGYDAELATWVWDEGAPERSDGIPSAAAEHGEGRAESLPGRWFSSPPEQPGEPPARERPTAVVLSSVGDAPEDWVHAGRALSAALLAATGLGLVAQPLGQVIDLPASRQALRVLLGLVGAPQMLLRIGHGTSVATAPRREVAEMLLPG